MWAGGWRSSSTTMSTRRRSSSRRFQAGAASSKGTSRSTKPRTSPSFGATLTLPGLAGIVLTIGMAVDANVLINERIREELRLGKSARAAIQAGYERAWSAIRDTNSNSFLAGIILFQFGSGPVRGFAVT